MTDCVPTTSHIGVEKTEVSTTTIRSETKIVVSRHCEPFPGKWKDSESKGYTNGSRGNPTGKLLRGWTKVEKTDLVSVSLFVVVTL